MAEVIIDQRIIERGLQLRPEKTEPKAAIKDHQDLSNELLNHPSCVGGDGGNDDRAQNQPHRPDREQQLPSRY